MWVGLPQVTKVDNGLQKSSVEFFRYTMVSHTQRIQNLLENRSISKGFCDICILLMLIANVNKNSNYSHAYSGRFVHGKHTVALEKVEESMTFNLQ